MSTAPWDPDAETAIRQTLAVVYAVRATHPSWSGPIVLDLLSGSVTFDEQWSPHVMADLEVVLPGDSATFDKIDPRDLVRLEVDAGYVYPGGTRDVHLLVNLGLRSRTVNRPGTSMRLTAMSDEILLQDAGQSFDFANLPSVPLPDLFNHLPLDLGYTPTMDLTACPTTAVSASFGTGTDLWTTYKNACDAAGAWLRDRGDRVWTVTAWPSTLGPSEHSLRAGPTGTLISSQVTQDRDDWANAVVLVYGDASIQGWALLTGSRAGLPSELGPALPGLKLYREDRKGPITQVQADTAAAAILRRLMRSGRTATLGARSAFWVRPGMTVSIGLPRGGEERHLVASVSFDLGSAQMTVATRQPDNGTIST